MCMYMYMYNIHVHNTNINFDYHYRNFNNDILSHIPQLIQAIIIWSDLCLHNSLHCRYSNLL